MVTTVVWPCSQRHASHNGAHTVCGREIPLRTAIFGIQPSLRVECDACLATLRGEHHVEH